MPRPTPEELRIRGLYDVTAEVLERHTVTYDELFSLSRKKHIVAARWELWWELSENKGWGYGPIGAMWDTDASTVMRGVKKVQ